MSGGGVDLVEKTPADVAARDPQIAGTVYRSALRRSPTYQLMRAQTDFDIYLLSPTVPDSMPMIEVSGTEETRILHGNEIQAAVDAPLARIFNKKGEFIAVAAVENGWVRPRLVLT